MDYVIISVIRIFKIYIKVILEAEQLFMVILDQNCARFSDDALNDLFFSNICFIKSSVNML